MIMPRGQQLLLPVNPAFIAVSLLIGLAINLVPLGRWVWLPDLLMVLIVLAEKLWPHNSSVMALTLRVETP